MVDEDCPDFYFHFLKGSQDFPNFNNVEIDKNWDCLFF